MNQLDQLAAVAEQAGCTVLRDEPMMRHTTFKIGGPADLFITIYDCAGAQQVYHTAYELEIPVLPIGNGSNMLVSDAGIRGAVVAFAGNFGAVSLAGETEIEAGVGATLAQVCAFAQEHSLTGLEFAWGIPGAVGGAAYMNAGAYDGVMKDVITACTHVTKEGEVGTLRGDELEFGYRHSAYTDNGSTILSARFSLRKGEKDQIRRVMDDLYSRRKSKQPLELPSAGSVFKRPPGHFAGALIEGCGLKGKRFGGAMVSEKHAGFIVNVGGATCDDVLKLIDYIKETVFRQTGVMLECEVRIFR
ncbi:MAG: UDP-N-acetylmuramate dehydrogenase [Ruminococcaceae bacterium]|nr:UDP-N-acetylmuramate dehydrogenase [Oscillospiraceae bacterium]HHV32838.1 UDP-N-acetylmuramate dehydrogenase [Clostridiales bacterium]